MSWHGQRRSRILQHTAMQYSHYINIGSSLRTSTTHDLWPRRRCWEIAVPWVFHSYQDTTVPTEINLRSMVEVAEHGRDASIMSASHSTTTSVSIRFCQGWYIPYSHQKYAVSTTRHGSGNSLVAAHRSSFHSLQHHWMYTMHSYAVMVPIHVSFWRE